MKFRVGNGAYIHETWPLDTHDFLMIVEEYRRRGAGDAVGIPVFHRLTNVPCLYKTERPLQYRHKVWPIPDETIEVIEP